MQRLRHRRHNLHALHHRKRLGLNSDFQIKPFDKFRNHKTRATVTAANIKHRNNIWMIQLGGGARLVQKFFHARWIHNQGVARNLDRNVAHQLIIMG